MDPLRKYEGETITLELPGEMTVFEIDWISIFDLETNENFGSVLITDGLNVPPSLTKIMPLIASLPNCRQLHRDLRVSWEVFGPQITIQLTGQVMEDEYMSFGLSGSESRSQMLGADVVVAYIDGARGYATDYNITSLAPVSIAIHQKEIYYLFYHPITIMNFIRSVFKYWVKIKAFVVMMLLVASTVFKYIHMVAKMV